MNTYKVIFDGLCFVVDLTDDEYKALKQDDGITVIPA